MADESNGESGFEFVEKKVEEFPAATIITTESPKTETPPNSNPVTTAAATASKAIGNLLSNVAPPTALPSFITNTVGMTTVTAVTSQPQHESNKIDNLKTTTTTTQLADGSIQTIESNASTSTSDNMPQVLDAPDSPTIDSTGALAGSLFTWVKDTVANSQVLSKVAEKAKSSVNSMITTLDPQMRDFIYSGGDIEIVVASDKESKVAPVREAFQDVFGNATVSGIKIETAFEAAQPVGFTSGVKAAQDRIAAIRKDSSIPDDIPVVAVENFLLEVGQNKWYDLGVIILEDVKRNVNLQTFTQMTPVPSQIVESAKESTPDSYSKDGLSVTIGSLMGANLQVPHTEWHSALTGVSRKDIIFLAAQSLAGIYKNTINPV